MSNNNNNPWLGLRTYSEGQVLYGRSEEINSLSQDILFNRQTVVYGKSGIGKSSLLNAGVFPILRRSNMFPVNVRLDHKSKKISYCEQIQRCVEDSLYSLRRDVVGNDGKKKILENLKGQKKELCSVVPNKAGESLWEYFHRHVFYNDLGEEIQPVIVFDQFEEIFTICKEEETRIMLFDQLADLINDVPPSYIYKETDKTEDDLDSEEDEVIDGNEDFVLIEDDEEEDSQAYNYLQEPKFHVVITLREDFLSYLERYTTNIPLLKHNRYCLRPLSDDQAGIIITDPVPGLISEEVAVEIICKITKSEPSKFKLRDGIAQLEVDSAILSLFLSELYKKKAPEDTTISIELVRAIGDNIITSFYEETIAGISEKSAEYLERRLVTDDERRDSIFEDRALSRGVTKEELKYLKDERLIHEFPWHDDGMRIEFTHDVLCKVALSHRQERINQKNLQEEEKKRQLLQDEKEQERTKRNLEYNHKKRATERNVLVHKGRRLIDNALDFGEFRSLSNTSTFNNADRILDIAKQWSRIFGDYLDDEKDSEFVNQQVFSDPMLNDSSCILIFKKGDKRIPTIDGLYGVELVYDGTLISDIFFKAKKILSDGSTSFDEPVYILGGYSGIHIDYDEKHREIQRKYLDESRNPIKTQDGYSIIKIQYDEYDNPIHVRYYNTLNGDLIPAKHNNGNYGFDSIFDKNGNEVERYFVDEVGCHTKIVTGVYGKRMVYDPHNFRLLSISNIDFNGDVMADIDGYITDKKVYDKNGVPTLDLYYDDNDQPWQTPDGTYGGIDIIDYSNKIITSLHVDEHGSYIANNDGVFKTISIFNNRKQIIEIYTEDVNKKIIEAEDKDAIKLFEYDEQGRILTFKVFDKERNPVYGQRFGYNKEGTHILHTIQLNIRGVGRYEDFDVEGIEYDFDNNKSLPVLQKFINEFNQYKVCNDGYYAIRTWEDDKERIVKQLYYDVDGTPMPNNSGVFGVKVEYLDEETTKRIYLDANENMMEDNNGVAFTTETKNSLGLFQVNYNNNGEPHANDDWVYVHQERENTNQGYIERLFVLNSAKEQIQIYRPHRADAGWGLVPCMFVETTFDDKGRPLSEFFKDANGHLVGDTDGDSYTTWEYDDNNNQVILSLYNVEGELRIRIKTRKDSKNRITEQSYINEQNNYIELERGYSGEIHDYNDEERTEIITYIDAKGEVCNNKDGFAHRIYWYDKSGHYIARKDVTIDGIIHDSIVFREFINTEKRVCAYYAHREDGQGNVIPNDNGSVYNYYEDDNKGRTIKNLYLNADKLPIPDSDGDYGLGYEYDDEKRLTIITCLDKHGLPHNNNIGYGIIHAFKDDEGRDIKRMHYTVEGTPIVLPQLIGCYGEKYEYPNEHNRIVGYLNENGEITTNNFGYAYREECLNPETGIRRVFFYDKDRNNTQSLEDDAKEFGYAIDFDDNWRHVVSLGKDGQVANNAAGYARRTELYEEGKLRFYKFIDADNKPMADSAGDYGTEILRSDDGSMVRYVSLNAKYECHINDYGYCFCDVITDIVGEHIRIYRDMEGNQVIPKLRLTKRVKNLLSRSKKKETLMSVFNCRQIGAICDCILGNVEGNGLGKKRGLCGTYVLLQYDGWKFGDDSEELGKIISNAKKQSKHLVLLPVTLNGSLLQEVGEIIELDFPAGQIGIRFKDWGINMDTLRIILEKQQEKEDP